MSDSASWSLLVGRWHRVNVRIHALFVAVAIFALFLATSDPQQQSPGYGLLGVAILLASVLAHEWGHFMASTRVGGGGDQIVVGPLGGLGPLEVPREPQLELIATLAGPLVNLAILLLAL